MDGKTTEGGNPMLAAGGLGLIGTIIIIVLVVAVVLWFLRRA